MAGFQVLFISRDEETSFIVGEEILKRGKRPRQFEGLRQEKTGRHAFAQGFFEPDGNLDGGERLPDDPGPLSVQIENRDIRSVFLIRGINRAAGIPHDRERKNGIIYLLDIAVDIVLDEVVEFPKIRIEDPDDDFPDLEILIKKKILGEIIPIGENG